MGIAGLRILAAEADLCLNSVRLVTLSDYDTVIAEAKLPQA